MADLTLTKTLSVAVPCHAMPVWDMGVSALVCMLIVSFRCMKKRRKCMHACIATGVLSNRQVEN